MVDRLFRMVGGLIEFKIVPYVHQIKGGTFDEERYYLQFKSIQ